MLTEYPDIEAPPRYVVWVWSPTSEQWTQVVDKTDKTRRLYFEHDAAQVLVGHLQEVFRRMDTNHDATYLPDGWPPG